MNKEKEIMRAIRTPNFENTSKTVTLSEKPEDKYANINSINETIEQTSLNGGGTVNIPDGKFVLNGPIILKNNINLHISDNTYLLFGEDINDFLTGTEDKKGCLLTSFEGTLLYNYSPLIYGNSVCNVAITGKGIIDGNGKDVWHHMRENQWDDRNKLQKQNNNNDSLEKRIYGKGHFLRVAFVNFINSETILIDGPSFINSGFWMIHPVLSKNITIRNVKLESHTINSDGIDPESCQNVLIENCDFHVSDDNIAIKSLRDLDGLSINMPSKNILVRNCKFGGIHGVSIGSEVSGGAENIYIYNCTSDKPLHTGILIKTNQNRGGTIKNIHFENISFSTCTIGFKIEMKYKNQTDYKRYPTVKDIYLKNITYDEILENSIILNGHEESPISNIRLENVIFKNNENKRIIKNVKNIIK